MIKYLIHKSRFLIFSACIFISINKIQAQNKVESPLKIAVVGITHGHSPLILNRKNKDDVSIVGIYETDQELVKSTIGKYDLNESIFYDNLNDMLDKVKPNAVVAFGSIYEHLMVVEACAPRGIHVMVEKPLATNLKHAEKMVDLANQNQILLLTNFETSWYASTAKAYQLINDSNYVGNIKKVVIHDGHQGPMEIGVGKEFLKWLTDPIQNGGGALIDFGCYGANLMTYFMNGEEPISVTAITRQFKPEIYPKVDDEATIIVNYSNSQCIIQASWNWPFSRKDMEIYGDKGYIIAVDQTKMRLRNPNSKNNVEQMITVKPKDIAVYEDPISYFVDAIKGKITVPKNGLYSLENNLVVVKILEAARKSAKSGKTVLLNN
jgi:predicted dehydrogenase